jgi:hypothetical protein
VGADLVGSEDADPIATVSRAPLRALAEPLPDRALRPTLDLGLHPIHGTRGLSMLAWTTFDVRFCARSDRCLISYRADAWLRESVEAVRFGTAVTMRDPSQGFALPK